MSNFVLKSIERTAAKDGERIALKTTFGEITYRQLWERSENLAAWLKANLTDDNTPVMVYGHKNPQMAVCFLACVKAGRAYCPVDISMPKDRVTDIAQTIGNKIILATEELKLSGFRTVAAAEIDRISTHEAENHVIEKTWARGEEVFYIIFTSGSTGKPKGVQITAHNLENFLRWSSDLVNKRIKISENKPVAFLNQAPFSFDLSVMDLYTCLTLGGTLVCLDKKLQTDMGSMFAYMEASGANCWVSTPSFAEMCLCDGGFSQKLLPELKLFLLCGERFTKETAEKLLDRFPEAKVVNTYGPTESTVAVTAADITKEVLESCDLLPIGMPKPGTGILLEDGEIIITGDTVAKGYYKNYEKTKEAFFTVEGGQWSGQPAYRTGDKGYFKDGNFYCTGRKDFQVKLHGYRIELGDIESNLMACAEVEQAAVLPKYSEGKIRSLTAFIKAPTMEGSFKDGKQIKDRLREKLPAYMVPKSIKFLQSMPVTANGKLDRKRLEAEFL